MVAISKLFLGGRLAARTLPTDSGLSGKYVSTLYHNIIRNMLSAEPGSAYGRITKGWQHEGRA